ncbi:MAG: hypothetical protein RML72_09725 [Bacteroidia bacterium]|nr:hypothetical protein [Bacteroidia bacterium]MDW8159134.1 hypothetical protein [Bacteroidia bacterium]
MKVLLIILDNTLKAWIERENKIEPLLFDEKEQITLKGYFDLKKQKIVTSQKVDSSNYYLIQLLGSAQFQEKNEHKKALEALISEHQSIFEKSILPWIELNLNEPIPTTIIYPSALPEKTLQLLKKQFALHLDIKKQVSWSQVIAEDYFVSSSTATQYAIILEWLGEDWALSLAQQKESKIEILESKVLPLCGYPPMATSITKYILFLYKQNRGNIPFSVSNQSFEYYMLLNHANQIYQQIENDQKYLSHEKIYLPHDSNAFEFNLEKSELQKSSLVKDTINAIVSQQIEEIMSILENNHLKLQSLSALLIVGSKLHFQSFLEQITNNENRINIKIYDTLQLAEISLQRWYESFCKLGENTQKEKNFTNVEVSNQAISPKIQEYSRVTTKDLIAGSIVVVYWPPSRGLKLRVISPGEFFARLEVIEITGTSANLKIHDILMVASEISVGKYLEVDLLRNNQNYGSYRTGAPVSKIELYNSA